MGDSGVPEEGEEERIFRKIKQESKRGDATWLKANMKMATLCLARARIVEVAGIITITRTGARGMMFGGSGATVAMTGSQRVEAERHIMSEVGKNDHRNKST